MTIREIAELIESYHPYLPDYHGCDGFKSGDPDTECTGIVSSLVPTVEVIRRAAELGCNMIYTHEVSYFMTPDFPEWRGSFDCRIYDEKRALLEDNGIVIYRDHDHAHAHRPDSIFRGVEKYLGWTYYRTGNGVLDGSCHVYEIPESTVESVNRHLMETIGMNGTRFIGRPDARIKKIAIVGHLYPGGFGTVKEENGFYSDYSTMLIEAMEKDGLQAIIPGEVIEWNVLSYIRDAAALGRDVACFNIGHFNFEELGSRFAVDWIGEILGHKVPVHYVPTGDIWNFQLR